MASDCRFKFGLACFGRVTCKVPDKVSQKVVDSKKTGKGSEDTNVYLIAKWVKKIIM
jgi:hypothetical protein